MANIMEIHDFSAPELDIYARISEVQLLNRAEPEKGIFIAESPKVIERALDSGCQPISFLVEHKHVEGEAKKLIRRCGDIPVYTAEFDVLTQLTGFKLTRGMLCAMRRPALPDIVDVCKNARRIAVLDELGKSTLTESGLQSELTLDTHSEHREQQRLDDRHDDTTLEDSTPNIKRST